MRSLCLLLLCATALFCQATKGPEYTQGEENGRYWQQMDRTVKTWFVAGYSAGSRRPECAVANRIGTVARNGATRNDMIDAVDRIYEEPANRGIPIASVLQLAERRFAGDSPEVNVRDIETARRRWMEKEKAVQ